MSGKLIVLDGLDGSGKETQMNLLCEHLKNCGRDFLRVPFPDYSSDSSALVKMYLGGYFGSDPDSVNAYAASAFFAVDRFASYAVKWKSFYENGGIILCDRYTTSNIIYQGCKLSDDEFTSFVKWLSDFEYKKLGLPKPDLVLYLNAPLWFSKNIIRTRSNKIDGSNAKDIHESDLKFLERVKFTAEKAAKVFGWREIDISCGENKVRSIESVGDEIISIADSIL